MGIYLPEIGTAEVERRAWCITWRNRKERKKTMGQWKTIGKPNAPDNAIKRIEWDAGDSDGVTGQARHTARWG